MTDRPPTTALDRLRAGLGLRQEAPSPADVDGPDSFPVPSAVPEPPVDPPPGDEPTGPEPAPQIRKTTTPPAGEGNSRTAPRRQAPGPNRANAMQEAVRRRELSRTRLRINLTWSLAVTLAIAIAVVASAAYLHPSRMPDEWFSRFWPWRAHVWSRYGGHVMWCINEARKRDGRFVCQIHFGQNGPDCLQIKAADGADLLRCRPWETTWPTDPAPHWSAAGPPRWSR